jgi:hypothetical protein
MTYTPTKPDQGPSPYLDAPKIQANFSVFNTAFSANHVSMNTFKQGDHLGVIIQKQANFPGLVKDSVVLFARDTTSKIDTQPQLYIKIPQFLPNKVQNRAMQLTYNKVNIAGPQYQTFMIGGYLVYMGTETGNTAPNTIISTQITLVPAPTTILMAIATANTFNTKSSGLGPEPFDMFTKIDNNAQFTVSSSANGSRLSIAYSFTWIAIGSA